MKKTTIFFLSLLLSVCVFAGCSSEKRENYRLATQLLGFPEKTEEEAVLDRFGLPDSSNQEERQQAYELLKGLEDYKDSKLLCEKLESNFAYEAMAEQYKNALESFKQGDFAQAKELLNQLSEEEFPEIPKYLAGMDAIEAYVGTWEGEITGTNYSSIIKCKIGKPFTIGGSDYSDCDWAVKALICIDVLKYTEGGYNDGITSFEIAKTTGPNHVTEKDTMNDKMILFMNDNSYQFISNPRQGVFGAISLEKVSDKELKLMELPYTISGTACITESITVSLTKQSS